MGNLFTRGKGIYFTQTIKGNRKGETMQTLMSTPKPSEVAAQTSELWGIAMEKLTNRPVTNHTEYVIKEELLETMGEFETLFKRVVSSIENYNKETLLAQHKLVQSSNLPPEAVRNLVDHMKDVLI